MKKFFLLLLFVGSVGFADANTTKEVDTNETNLTKEDLVKKQIEEQMKREEKYAKEQKFYQGSEYNLSEAQVNEKSLSTIPVIEPDFDFNMDDTYSDEQ